MLSDLTPQENKVLTLMAQGLSNEGIAERIYVVLGTAENISTAIFDKRLIASDDHNHRRVMAVLAWQKEHKVTT